MNYVTISCDYDFFCDSCDSCDCECDLIVNEVVAGAVWKRKEKKVRKEKVKKKKLRVT